MYPVLAMLDALTVPLHPYLASLISLCVVVVVLLFRRPVNPPPPGPRRLPIIGNVFDFPEGLAATHWAKHKDLYGKLPCMAIKTDVSILNIIIGPISSVQALGTTFIIINDVKIASDLLEKRSAKYSHRPFASFAGKLSARLFLFRLRRS